MFAPASSTKLVKKMIKLAEKILDNARDVGPETFFTRDVFRYSREAGKIEVTKEYKI